jgi:type II secretory pathway pseudopilin PulG
MKLFPAIKSFRRRNISAFTLVEMMVTITIFLFIFTGVMVGIQIFGMRVYTLAATKLMATASARTALNQIRDQIREAKIVTVGNCSAPVLASFAPIALSNAQAGSALEIYPTTNMNYVSIYYLDTSTATNYLTQFYATNGVVTYTNQLASYVTNTVIFDAEDYLGNICTNEVSLDNRIVIKMTLQFSQWEYPIAFVGGTGFNAYDYYQLRTRIFRRAFD